MPARKTTPEFIKDCIEIHGDTLSYDKTVYINQSVKVIVTCEKHGDMKVLPKSFLSKSKQKGCPKCNQDVGRHKKRSTTEEFIAKASTKFNLKFTYLKTDYVNKKCPVIITCPIHGDFTQTPMSHLSSIYGCPSCIKTNKRSGTWTYSGWEAAGKISDNFEGFSLYILECWNNSEKFFKIGKTFQNINKRYKTKERLPYSWKVIKQIYGDARYISELERSYHKLVQPYKYIPKNPFGGMHECFTTIDTIPS